MSSPNSQSQQLHWHYTELDDHDFKIGGRTLFFSIVLFSVVLILGVLFIYVRWVFRWQQQQNFQGRSMDPMPSPRFHGLNPETIRAIPVILYQSSSSVERECCICLGVVEEGDKVKVLPRCRHFFHSECVDTWLTGQDSCPLCRASLRGGDGNEVVLNITE